MIKLENIQKVFRPEEVETVALGGMSLEVKKGEFVAIMGPRGEGICAPSFCSLSTFSSGLNY